jgi:hypothetical protein
MICTETFEARYGGETVRLVAGLDRVHPDHELVRRYPGRFADDNPHSRRRSRISHTKEATSMADPWLDDRALRREEADSKAHNDALEALDAHRFAAELNTVFAAYVDRAGRPLPGFERLVERAG